MYEKTEEPFSALSCQGVKWSISILSKSKLDIGRPNLEDKVELPLILASGVLV